MFPGTAIEVEGTRLRLPRPAGLLLEELERAYRALRPELRHAVRSNLTILSLLGPRAGMPDPAPRRADVVALLRRLEAGDPDLA